MKAFSAGWHEAKATAPVLVLFHGWGMKKEVWQCWLPYLTPHFRVLAVDLPNADDEATADAFESALMAELFRKQCQRVVWLGWSLGGLYATRMAQRYPEQTQALCLLAANPCFLQKPDWQAAMSPAVFGEFEAAFNTEPESALKNFLQLQCKGSISHKADNRYLRNFLSATTTENIAKLTTGLNQLSRYDVRAILRESAAPLLLILGENDVLVPTTLADSVHGLRPDATLYLQTEAAHAPFVSHPEACAAVLRQWCEAFA